MNTDTTRQFNAVADDSTPSHQDELIIVGCRAGSPGDLGAASGYVLLAANKTILIDCGPGVVLGLAQLGLITKLDAVINTHPHADHCADLLALAYHRLFPHRLTPLPIYAPPQLTHVMNLLDEAFGIPSLPELRKPLSAAFVSHQVTPGTSCNVAGLVVETLPAQHPIPTMAIKFPMLGFVFTADGALHPELVEFAKGARCLLAEATYPEQGEHDLISHGHMTAGQAGELARDAAVKTLVITHLCASADIEPTLRNARAAFRGDTQLASPGLRISLEP
jgi:ribonuclease BN (tRNA processing enzyme)